MPCVTKWAGWSRTCAVRSRARIKSLDARLRHHLHTVTCSALNALLTEFGLAPHPHLVVAVEGQTELVLFARNAKLGVPSDDDFIVAEDAGAPTAIFRHWSHTLWRHASSARPSRDGRPMRSARTSADTPLRRLRRRGQIRHLRTSSLTSSSALAWSLTIQCISLVHTGRFGKHQGRDEEVHKGPTTRGNA
jgi:hypothetical protein